MIARVRARGGQGGYALLAVLVAIGVFALVVMALLDLVGTDNGTTSAAQDSARQRRAGDGALQMGIAQLKATSKARLAGNSDPCAGLAADPATQADPSHPVVDVQIEGRSMRVDCTIPSGPTPPSVISPLGTGPVLTAVKNYDIAAIDDSGKFVSALVKLFGGNPDDGPGLAHVGPEPLRVYGDVKVRQWGLGVTPKATGASVVIDGSYQEGDAQGAACGAANGDLLDPPKVFAFSATGTRQCGAGRANVVAANGPGTTAPTPPTNAVTLPACTNGTVVRLPHGVYTADQITTLNGWFATGSCDNVTFWFEPGDYSFQSPADGSTAILAFNDATSNWVFGTPNGWTSPARATDANFPEACDRTKPGVTITLGPSTSLQQTSGQVAICGAKQNDGIPAIYQGAAGSLADAPWAGAPTTVVAEFGNPPDPANVARTVAPAEASDFFTTFGRHLDTSEGTEATRQDSSWFCTNGCGRAYVMTGFAGARPAPTRKLSTAVLKIRASATNVVDGVDWGPVGRSRVIVTVTLAKPTPTSPTVACQSIRNVWPGVMTTPIEINLLDLNPPNNCSGVIKSAKDLETASINVLFLVNPGTYDCSGGFCYARVKVDHAWVETHTGTTATDTPKPMSVVIDPTHAKSFNVFDDIYLPYTQIDVKWAGGAAVPPRELPLFVGQVVTRGLASSTLGTSDHIGPLAARSLAPVTRHVLLRAQTNGMLVATAEVQISDKDATGKFLDPAVSLSVTDWKYCNVPMTATATC